MIAVFDTNIVIDALTSILAEQFDRGAGLEKAIRANLKGIGRLMDRKAHFLYMRTLSCISFGIFYI